MTQKNTISLTTIEGRAKWLQGMGDIEAAISDLGKNALNVSLTEALILGLMRQGITKYLAIFGHGSTVIGDVLSVYEDHGLIKCWQFRNEIEMAHAGTALKWVYGETCAVVTSIGPGALQAMSASLVASSNGLGIYHIYGDETTYGEGYNMQQIPSPQQNQFGQLTAIMGGTYTMHSPNAIRDALRQGSLTVFNPIKPKPFFINMPINTQASMIELHLHTLPKKPIAQLVAPVDQGLYIEAVNLMKCARKIAIKAGGGTRKMSKELRRFVELSGAVVVQSPGSLGVLPDAHLQNMHVGGSKGSISGNFAMQEADLLIVVGSRAVCQSDCSGTGWPKVKKVININADFHDAFHYNETLALCGEGSTILNLLNKQLAKTPTGISNSKKPWLDECAAAKDKWISFKADRIQAPLLKDDVWRKNILTKTRAIKTVANFCKQHNAIKFFDAGDIQANGFQIIEDDEPYQTFTETGASYMGFAVSALLAGGLADTPQYSVAFTGDGSFMMNPQVLIDGVEHGLHGTIVVFDNRRMAAISSLQISQFGREYRTSDNVAVDYVKMANSVAGVRGIFGGYDQQTLLEALDLAKQHQGLSLIHVPVYFGDNKLGGMGTFGDWNVGNWCDEVQEKYLSSLI